MKQPSLLLLCATLFVGCGKKSAAPPAPPTRQPEAAASDPAEADRAATLNRLTQTVRRYSAENRRVPKDFQEMVTAGYLIEVPVPPPGQKYIIDPKLQVKLEDVK